MFGLAQVPAVTCVALTRAKLGLGIYINLNPVKPTEGRVLSADRVLHALFEDARRKSHIADRQITTGDSARTCRVCGEEGHLA
jgi:hypothetical protein